MVGGFQAWKILVMPDEGFISLEDTVQAHEAELDRQTKEIAALKDDLKLVLKRNPRSSESNQTSVDPPPTKIDALRQVSPGCAIDSPKKMDGLYATIDSQRNTRHREGDYLGQGAE